MKDILFSALATLALFSPVGYADDFSKDLLAHYPLDGDGNDVSGNAAHGIVTGANPARGVDGERRAALEFDGEDDYVHLPLDINPEQLPQLTITLWVNAYELDRRQIVISHDDGGYDRSLRLSSTEDSPAGWTAYCGERVMTRGSRPAENGEWVFLAVAYDQDAETVDFFVDGRHFQRKGCELGRGFQYVTLGMGPNAGKNFRGKIDEVRVYSRALRAAEIARLAELSGN